MISAFYANARVGLEKIVLCITLPEYLGILENFIKTALSNRDIAIYHI